MNYYQKSREFSHDYEHYSYPALKTVRDQLLKDIQKYETGDQDFIPIDEDLPTAKDQYLADLLYARNVFEMLFDRYKNESA